MKVGAILGFNDLKAIWDALNGWRVVALALKQASHTRLAAVRAPQFFVPLFDHPNNMHPATFPVTIKNAERSTIVITVTPARERRLLGRRL
jgi:hypothetical protein